MVSDTYQTLLNQIQHLSPEEQFQLLGDLVVMLQQRAITNQQHSILELAGLGKEVWQSVDVEEYIKQERETWKGIRIYYQILEVSSRSISWVENTGAHVI